MKLHLKKIYCSSRQRLVKGREQQMENGNMRLLCSRCGRPLYIWNGIIWRFMGQGV